MSGVTRRDVTGEPEDERASPGGPGHDLLAVGDDAACQFLALHCAHRLALLAHADDRHRIQPGEQCAIGELHIMTTRHQ